MSGWVVDEWKINLILTDFFVFISWNLLCFEYFKFSVKQKNKIFMKKLKDIRAMIQTAQQEWSEIEGETSENPSSLCRSTITVKMEKLKNFLEDIRMNIENLLIYSRCSMLVKVCKNFLENILAISENLRASYVFPGYVESYYILDTMNFAESSNE